jgi:hypothetical protein
MDENIRSGDASERPRRLVCEEQRVLSEAAEEERGQKEHRQSAACRGAIPERRQGSREPEAQDRPGKERVVNPAKDLGRRKPSKQDEGEGCEGRGQEGPRHPRDP